jgi:hypothetical protein
VIGDVRTLMLATVPTFCSTLSRYLPVVERLSAHQENGARKLCAKAERIVVAEILADKIVSGDVDYIFGYKDPSGDPHKEFESNVIVIEAKKKSTFDAGLGQVLCYMGKPFNTSLTALCCGTRTDSTHL